MGEKRINVFLHIPSKCRDRVVRKKVIGVTQTNLSAVCFIANILRRIGYYFFVCTHSRFNLTEDDEDSLVIMSM